MKNTLIILIFSLFYLPSCKEEREEKKELPKMELLNSFYLIIDGEKWEPSIIDNDTCLVTLYCDFHSFHEQNKIVYQYYIIAVRDVLSRYSDESDNKFKLYLTKIDSVGIYYISGSQVDDENSYAIFTDNKKGSKYVNSKQDSTFKVTIEELITLPDENAIGITGEISGILYNEVNPRDSIIIDESNFMFKRFNRTHFIQCSNWIDYQ